MKIACCQFDMEWENKPANHARVAGMLRESRLGAGSLVVLPEMFATGFSMNVAGIEDTSDQLTQRFLSSLAAELGINIIGGVVSAGAKGMGYNEAVGYGPGGGEILRYRKMHPFGFSGENKHYLPGHRVVSFGIGGLRVCPLICYDLRFPEPFRVGLRQGADCFLVIASWPKQREQHWLTLLQARAIENQAYVAGVNRIGKDPNAEYGGRSLLIDPRGNILADAGTAETIIAADFDCEVVANYRNEFPVLSDIRADYGEIE
jgi:predicted amidohydrolase